MEEKFSAHPLSDLIHLSAVFSHLSAKANFLLQSRSAKAENLQKNKTQLLNHQIPSLHQLQRSRICLSQTHIFTANADFYGSENNLLEPLIIH